MSNLNELKLELADKIEDLEELQGNLLAMENDHLAYFEDEITSSYDDNLNEVYGEQLDALPFYRGSAASLCKE